MITTYEICLFALIPAQVESGIGQPESDSPFHASIRFWTGIRSKTSFSGYLNGMALPIPAILKLKPLWTGKQIFSLAIPRGINIHRSPDPKSFLTMVF